MISDFEVILGENKISIEFPVNLLLFTQENRDDIPFKVTDIDKMFKWLQEHLLQYDHNEDGSTAFTNFIDNAFLYAYEHGEAWLEGIVPDEIE